MWVSMCFPRAVDSYFIVKKRPYSLAKIATRGVRPGYNERRAASFYALELHMDVYELCSATKNHFAYCYWEFSRDKFRTGKYTPEPENP